MTNFKASWQELQKKIINSKITPNYTLMLLGAIFAICIFLSFLYYAFGPNLPDNQNLVKTTPSPTTQKVSIMNTADCNAQVIACDPQFQENKGAACGAFKSVAVDNLLSRDDSPCKGLDRPFVEAELDKACSQGCQPTSSQPTPTTRLDPTNPPSNNSSSMRFNLPGIGSGQFENSNPKRQSRSATIQIFDANKNKIDEKNIQFSFDSQSKAYKTQLSSYSNASYVILKTDGTLSKKFQPIDSLQTLISGDLDNNNSMDIQDYTNMLACYKNTNGCTSSSKITADFNDDGSISNDDLNIVQRAFSSPNGELMGE